MAKTKKSFHPVYIFIIVGILGLLMLLALPVYILFKSVDPFSKERIVLTCVLECRNDDQCSDQCTKEELDKLSPQQFEKLLK